MFNLHFGPNILKIIWELLEKDLLSQQSKAEGPPAQLSVPHTRSPAHSLSRSQSPSPSSQGAEFVQQEECWFAGLQSTNIGE